MSKAAELAELERLLAWVHHATETFWLNLLEEQRGLQEEWRDGLWEGRAEAFDVRYAEVSSQLAGVRVFETLLAESAARERRALFGDSADLDLDAVAAFFDSRGSLGVTISRVTIIISSQLRERSTLEALQAAYGFGQIGTHSAKANRIVWRVTRKEDVSTFLRSIRPHLVAKAALVDAALLLLDRLGAAWSLSQEERAVRAGLVATIKALLPYQVRRRRSKDHP